MGAKTLKRLAILVTTILVAGLSIFLVQRYQVGRMDRSVLDQAARAEGVGNFEDAARFYQEHLEVAPDDWEAKLKYADVLRKGSKDASRRLQAAKMYEEYVSRFPKEKENVRRRLAELYVEMGAYPNARRHLEIVEKAEPNDGAICFLLGRCQEAMNEPAKAMESYKRAIEHDAPQRPEADARLATLQVQPNAANFEVVKNKAIKKMVEDHPTNYKVYLERGSFVRRFGPTPGDRKSAKDDLERALKMATDDPKVYAELAELARSSKNFEEARRVIEAGLKVLPKDPSLHLGRAYLERSNPSGSIDKAITSLRQSLELLPDDAMVRLTLADLVAQRGGNEKELQTQIEELKRLNIRPIYTGLLEAQNLITGKEWNKAFLLLTRLKQLEEQSEEQKSRVQYLLAQCYRQLGNRDRELEAYQSSIRANPRDLQARLELAASYEARGELAAAIKEYRVLEDLFQREQRVAELTKIRFRLVKLSIRRNQQLPVEQRGWDEVKTLIDLVKESTPESSSRVILETEFLAAKGEIAKAQDMLEKARSQFPRDVDLWVMSAEILRLQGKLDDARKLLDQAQKSLGDSLALRLERSQVLVSRGGAELPKALGALAANSDSFPAADRRRLLEVLAQEAARLDDRTLVTDLWSRVAELDPKDLEPRLRLFELALQGKSKSEIENRLKEIKEIEGSSGAKAKYGEALYTIWQSENTTDRLEQTKLRSTAQLQLKDLKSQLPDRPLISRKLADLTLADMFQPELSDEMKKRKAGDATDLYLQAIKLGQGDQDTIRRATDLLYVVGRRAEVIPLWTQLSKTSPAGSTVLVQGSLDAYRHRDLEGALELARQAKAANPNDFQVRHLLAQRLIDKQLLDDAENELRQAVAAAPSDPARWITLVEFLALTKIKDTEKAVLEAEAALKEKPIGPARCCELLGRAYKTASQDDQASKYWLERARRWYGKAQMDQPNDLTVTRQYFEFLLGSGQIPELELLLKKVLENNEPRNAEKRALARRFKAALTLQASTDTEQRRKARDVLEEMDRANEAGPEDRFRLALIYSQDGDWTKARDMYKRIIEQTENTGDFTVYNRRLDYIAQFIDELLKRSQGDQKQEVLSETQDLIEKLKALRPNEFRVVEFEARLDKARGRMDKAIELIQAITKRPGLSDLSWQLLAKLANQLGDTKFAEQLLRQLVEKSDRPQNRLALALFLGRQGQFQEALDQCEPLWNATSKPEELVKGTLDVLSLPDADRDKTRLDRVASWLEKGLEKQPKSSLLATALAGLRERLGRFQDAEALYAQGVEKGSENVTALNNLAWLMALRNGDLNKALDFADRAIKLGGPKSELLDTRGVIYTKLGKSQGAITDLIEATKQDASGPKYFHLAQAYLQAGNKQAAAESWAKARAQGLTPDRLHPLELPAYQKLLKDLGTT